MDRRKRVVTAPTAVRPPLTPSSTLTTPCLIVRYGVKDACQGVGGCSKEAPQMPLRDGAIGPGVCAEQAARRLVLERNAGA